MSRYSFTFLIAFILIAAAQLATNPAQAQSTQTPPPDCVFNNGVLDASAFTAADSYCIGAPDYYGLTIYEIGLCTATPSAPSTSETLDMSNCQTVYVSDTGEAVEVEDGVTRPLTGGRFTRPQIGTYTHAFFKIANRIDIRNSLEFSTTMTTIDGDSGQFCWSKTVEVDPAVTTTEPLIECGTSAPATSEIGTTTDILGDFGTGDNDQAIRFVSIPVSTGTLTAYLIDADGHLPTQDEAVTHILAVQQFTTPPAVTATTTYMDLAFRVSQGMSVSVDSANLTRIGHFSSGPFAAQISVSNQ